MKIKESKLIDGSDKKFSEVKEQNSDNIKGSEHPLCYECDGVKVRVVFEGTADLNEIVKGLFLAG